MTKTHKFMNVWLFSFKKLTLKDKLIILVFTHCGYRPTFTTVNDQWNKGNLTLVHDKADGWYQYDSTREEVWDL